MTELTDRQRQIVDYLERRQQADGVPPTFRDLAAHFRLSVGTVVDHIRALREKGILPAKSGRARSLRLAAPARAMRAGGLVQIPIYGAIPAGFADDRRQEAKGCLAIDLETLGLKPTPRTFALEVRGDSMIGRHILEGDLVVLEHGVTPRPGDVVAALIDNESTLKTFVQERGKPPCLRAENPKFPKLVPATELVIQGVMVALVRKMK